MNKTEFTPKQEIALEKLDAVEMEMKKIGYWSEDPPDLLGQYESGELRSYLDAPSFELWLQCVFLPNARNAVTNNQFPGSSQVGLMAMREYDYHSTVPEAHGLMGLLYEFDDIIENH